MQLKEHFKMKLVDLIPIQEEESVADQDMKAAEGLKIKMGMTIRMIDAHMQQIEKELSSANSPGLKHAFIDALRVGVKRQGKFDVRGAKKHFDKYFKR